MELKSILSILISSIIIVLLAGYWFIPFGEVNFGESRNYNFSLNNSNPGNIQFYGNMRYMDKEISYRIHDCSLQKKNDMERAFGFLSDSTILNFYSVDSNEEISVSCDEENKPGRELFIAGEGGPVNITQAGKFNVIYNGEVLLIKDSFCYESNIGIHELLHALGFAHSSNPKNIMYPVSDCKQSIGQDTIDLIDEIYSIPNYPDLVFEKVSAKMNGKYLDVSMTVRNNGLANSQQGRILIFAEEKSLKEIDLNSIDIGFGTTIKLTNVWVPKITVDELEFVIDYSPEELDRQNNNVTLTIKK